jgi:hypothetical protein
MAQSEEKLSAFNIFKVYEYSGIFDEVRFRRSVETLVQRHESLRTVFFISESGLQQRILPGSESELVTLTSGSLEVEIQNQLHEHQQKLFDLEHGPVFSVRVIRVSEERHIISICVPHICVDRWSWNILIRDLNTLYFSSEQATVGSIDKLRFQYKDFAAYQNTLLATSHDRNLLSNYWRNKLADCHPMRLAYDFYEKPTALLGDRYEFVVEGELLDQIKKGCAYLNVSPYVLVLAVIKLVLYKWTNEKDIIIGSPFAGRQLLESKDQIGIFMHTLPLRNVVREELTFSEWVAAVKETFLGAFEHQFYPYEQIMDDLGLVSHNGGDPLVEAGLTWLNTNEQVIDEITEVKVVELLTESELVRHHLWFYVLELSGNMEFSIQYNDQYKCKKSGQD